MAPGFPEQRQALSPNRKTSVEPARDTHPPGSVWHVLAVSNPLYPKAIQVILYVHFP